MYLFFREKTMQSSLKQRRINQLLIRTKTIRIPVLKPRPQPKIQTPVTVVNMSPVMKRMTIRMTPMTLRYVYVAHTKCYHVHFVK